MSGAKENRPFSKIIAIVHVNADRHKVINKSHSLNELFVRQKSVSVPLETSHQM